MKYSFIEIKPNFLEMRWDIGFDDTDKYDREPSENYEPHTLGFFYFPRRWKVRKAFDVLKAKMIKDRMETIEALLKDVEEIKNLELPEWIKEREKK